MLYKSMNNHENYSTQQARNKRAKELQAKGYLVRKSSTGPCELHPMYIEDLKHTFDGQDTGFGNVVYKTYFKNVYQVYFERS